MKPSTLSPLAIAILLAALPGCGGPRGEAAAPATPAPAPVAEADHPEAGAPSEEAETRGDHASFGEDPTAPKPPPFTPFGVPECDRFVEKYTACVDLHVPADQKDRMLRELHVHRARWRELEKMQNGKVAAGLSCRGVGQRLRSDLIVDYGCEF